jgi:hypothetical protein
VALVLIDFMPKPFPVFSEMPSRPVDAWLASQPGKGAYVQMPFDESEEQEQTYYTLFNGKPFVGGFFNAFPPAQYQKIKPIMKWFPDATSMGLLKELGVAYVIVDKKAYPTPGLIKEQCISLGLKFEAEIGDQWVFVWR